MSFEQLEGYKPQDPADSGFEPFRYEGPVKINKAIIGVNNNVDSEFYPIGCNQIEIEAEVVKGENEGRKLWKRFNLDSNKAEGKKSPKTPIQKLADQFFAVGLEFKDMDSLKDACAKFADMVIFIKAWPGKFGGETKQIWNIKGIAPKGWEQEKAPKVEF